MAELTTSAGNITVPNITAGTSVSSTTFIDFPGSNIDYQPPTGTTLVACEIKFYAGMADHSGHVLSLIHISEPTRPY